MKKLILGKQSIRLGRGAIDSLKEIQKKRVFIVTGGQSMFKNGTISRMEALLNETGCDTLVYSGVSKNPDTQAVIDGVEKMRQFNPDIIIGVGGGSPIDAAKVMALFYDYPQINFENALTTELPEALRTLQFIAIPSTSGTGTEVTKAAVITFKEKNLKIGLKTEAFIPHLAILDGELTMTMPQNIVAETGMDAMTHAVECYLNRNLDDFSEALAQSAITGLFEYLPISYLDKTAESREKVHHYQCMAGLAFGNVGLGMVHGIAHAFGGMFDLGHGLLNAVALPYVLEFNARDAGIKARLQRLSGQLGGKEFISAVRELNEKLNIPRSFKEVGISQEQFEGAFSQLVENSMKGSTRVNPVPVTEEEMAQLLRAIFEGKDIL